jgi:hypothetical protein
VSREYPAIIRSYVSLAAPLTAALAADTYPDDSPDEPVVESLNQTVERATWNLERLD